MGPCGPLLPNSDATRSNPSMGDSCISPCHLAMAIGQESEPSREQHGLGEPEQNKILQSLISGTCLKPQGGRQDLIKPPSKAQG